MFLATLLIIYLILHRSVSPLTLWPTCCSLLRFPHTLMTHTSTVLWTSSGIHLPPPAEVNLQRNRQQRATKKKPYTFSSNHHLHLPRLQHSSRFQLKSKHWLALWAGLFLVADKQNVQFQPRPPLRRKRCVTAESIPQDDTTHTLLGWYLYPSLEFDPSAADLWLSLATARPE